MSIEAMKQEPVAWMDASETMLSWENFLDGMKPLYTTPPAAQEEIQRLSALVRAQQITIDKLEAQLREKNAGETK